MAKKMLFLSIITVIHILIAWALLQVEKALIIRFGDPHFVYVTLPASTSIIFIALNISALSWLYYLLLFRGFFKDLRWFSPAIIVAFLAAIHIFFLILFRLSLFDSPSLGDLSRVWADLRFDLLHAFLPLAVNLYLGLLVYKTLRKTLFKTL